MGQRDGACLPPRPRRACQDFIHDGYLKKSGSEYKFVSHLLRDWWKNRFDFGYVPVKKRLESK